MRLSRNPGRVLLAVLLPAVLIVPFLVPIDHELKRLFLVAFLGSRVHILVFFLLTLIAYWYGPVAGNLLRVVLVVAGLGIAIEIVQEFFGRSCRVQDFWLDVQGIALAWSWLHWRRHRGRRGPIVAAVVIAIILGTAWRLPGTVIGQKLVRERFPVLANFETSSGRMLWGKHLEGRIEFITADSTGTFLRVHGPGGERYSGAEMSHFPWDWAECVRLEGDLRIEPGGVEGRGLSVLLTDYPGFLSADWVCVRIEATDQWQSFSIDLAELRTQRDGRPLVLDDMVDLTILLGSTDEATFFDIDNLRLVLR